MKTLIPYVVLCLAGLGLQYSGAQEKKENYGWKVGNLMPFHVVDFVAGPRHEGGGCPSVMISNSKGRGIIIWSKESNKAYQLASILDGKLAAHKSLGFFVDFSSNKAEAVRQQAEKHGLKHFHATTPRSLTGKQLNSVDGASKAGTVIFFLERKEIKRIWPVEPGQLNDELTQMIGRETDRFLAGKE